jgi:hypothetical protein
MNLGIPIVVLEGSNFANEVLGIKDEYDSNGYPESEFNTFYAGRKEV